MAGVKGMGDLGTTEMMGDLDNTFENQNVSLSTILTSEKRNQLKISKM